jgi:hypothetical protein
MSNGQSVKIWLNAFIPGDIPGLTNIVPGSGSHAGKTMIPGPTPVNDCFLTDQRSFSANPSASSRMHSEIEIDLTVPRIVSEFHRCDPTIEVDCEDGDEECNSSANTGRMKFLNFRSTSIVAVDIVGAANNPCFTGSPDIDYEGTIEITIDPSTQIVSVAFSGRIEPFPAFEMYATLNGGSSMPIFRESPVPGATPRDLFGDANRPVSGRVEL